MSNFLPEKENVSQILSFAKDNMENILNSKNFSGKNILINDSYINQSTMCYLPIRKELYILEQENDNISKELKFYLWSFSFLLVENFKNEINNKNNENFTRSKLVFMDEKCQEMVFKDNGVMNMICGIYEEEDQYLAIYNTNNVFGKLIKVLYFVIL